MHKYIPIAVFTLLTAGCSHLPWTNCPEPEERKVDCQKILEQGASQSKYFACLSQQESEEGTR